MDANKQKKLEAAGWKMGDVNDFLNLTKAEAKQIEIKVELTLSTKNKKKKP